jgi:hypothetical protein
VVGAFVVFEKVKPTAGIRLAFESFMDCSERLDIVGAFLKWNAYLLSVRASGGAPEDMLSCGTKTRN